MVLLIIVGIIAFLALGSSSATDKDPIESAAEKWNDHPEDLNMEDMFWLDEIWGDD